MIEVRSVANLGDLVPILQEMKSNRIISDFRVWKRGRELVIEHTSEALDESGAVVGEEVVEAHFQLEPVGTSSAKTGYDRWLVYFDKWRPALAIAPTDHQNEETLCRYRRPSRSLICCRLEDIVSRLFDSVDVVPVGSKKWQRGKSVRVRSRCRDTNTESDPFSDAT